MNKTYLVLKMYCLSTKVKMNSTFWSKIF